MPEARDQAQAWDRGNGITGSIKEVAGEFAKDWRDASGVIAGVKATGRNLRAMGEVLVEQGPNMIAPAAGLPAGAVRSVRAQGLHPALGEGCEYFILAETFKGEICSGLDHQAVCRVLVEHGCLTVKEAGHHTISLGLMGDENYPLGFAA